ncbi:MAG: hypothetical protein GX221_02330 [Candidatus Riflebacteria bacterium]|nr:hypothetical protein [Candidatus Riflebacteria bacterium]
MDVKKFKEIIKERERISVVSSDNDDFAIDKCWEELTELLSKNIEATIEYIENECDNNEFAWISEVFDFVAKKTQSQEFIDALNRYADAHPSVHDLCNIRGSIGFAQAEIKFRNQAE